jgi:hypothetical protein
VGQCGKERGDKTSSHCQCHYLMSSPDLGQSYSITCFSDPPQAPLGIFQGTLHHRVASSQGHYITYLCMSPWSKGINPYFYFIDTRLSTVANSGIYHVESEKHNFESWHFISQEDFPLSWFLGGLRN